jgi:hypothetical protein
MSLPGDLRSCAMTLLVLVHLVSAGLGAGQESVSLTQQVLAHPGFSWQSLHDGAVRLHYQPATFAERHRIMLLRSANAAVARGIDFLGLSGYERQLNVFYVDNRQQMEQLVGRPVSGYSDWTGSGVFLVCNPDWRSFDAHEIAHVLSIGQWGWPSQSSRWMIEGLPTAIDGWCQEFDIDTMARYLSETGVWPGLEIFSTEYTELGEVRAGILAASLIRYLRGEYGPEAIRSLWLNGPAEFASSLGMDLDRIEEDWKSHLDQIPDSMVNTDWDEIDAHGCG